jgi:KipI family sensor histidine kinase inhibitor
VAPPLATPFPRLQPFGEAALLVELGDQPDLAINARVHALAAALRTARLTGLVSAVPAYVSLLVEFDLAATTYEAVEASVQAYLAALGTPALGASVGRLRQVPVVYGGAFGPDLDGVARRLGLAPEAAIALHTGAEQTVYMLGFSPGFPYLGDLPDTLAMTRLETPRERVPVGSVAIAGRQTGIYSQPSPGGWHLLGRTPIRLFDAERDPPAYFAPGDRVRFRSIPAADWERYAGAPADW